MATLVTKVCSTCSTRFTVKPYREKTAHYCSFSCRGRCKDWRAKVSSSNLGKPRSESVKRKLSEVAKARRGDKNPNWRGGKTPLILAIRTSENGRQWRDEVFRRDGWSCVRCGSPSRGNIEAHHKVALSKLVKDHSIATIDEALLCSAVWSVDNGETLCKTCHAQTDNYKAKAI